MKVVYLGFTDWTVFGFYADAFHFFVSAFLSASTSLIEARNLSSDSWVRANMNCVSDSLFVSVIISSASILDALAFLKREPHSFGLREYNRLASSEPALISILALYFSLISLWFFGSI